MILTYAWQQVSVSCTVVGIQSKGCIGLPSQSKQHSGKAKE